MAVKPGRKFITFSDQWWYTVDNHSPVYIPQGSVGEIRAFHRSIDVYPEDNDAYTIYANANFREGNLNHVFNGPGEVQALCSLLHDPEIPIMWYISAKLPDEDIGNHMLDGWRGVAAGAIAAQLAHTAFGGDDMKPKL